MNRWIKVLCLGVAFHFIAFSAKAGKENTVIKDGNTVSFDYTLIIDDKVIDSSQGKEPLQYVQGKGEIVPGLEKELVGMHVGEEKMVKVTPQEGYGEIDPKAYREIPKTSLPADLKLEQGMMLAMTGPDGQVLPVKVSEIKENSVVLDLNHPLAGKILNFQIKVVNVQ